MKARVAIIGCGKVGTSLARYMSQIGCTVYGLASRTLSSAEKVAKLVGCERYSTNALEIIKGTELVFITTPDGIIAKVCTALAEENGFEEGVQVFHCSGSLPSTILEPARRSGAIIGSMHPLQSFARDYGDINPFKGIVMAVEGDEKAVETGLTLSELLESKGFRIETHAKTLYHASAVVASNCLVTLIDFAYQLLESSGIGSKDAYTVLGPLVEGTLANIKTVGPTDALTGPVIRGDAATVSDHLEAIETSLPHLKQLYTVLGRHTLDVAKRRGTLTDQEISALTSLLP